MKAQHFSASCDLPNTSADSYFVGKNRASVQTCKASKREGVRINEDRHSRGSTVTRMVERKFYFLLQRLLDLK